MVGAWPLPVKEEKRNPGGWAREKQKTSFCSQGTGGRRVGNEPRRSAGYLCLEGVDTVQAWNAGQPWEKARPASRLALAASLARSKSSPPPKWSRMPLTWNSWVVPVLVFKDLLEMVA